VGFSLVAWRAANATRWIAIAVVGVTEQPMFRCRASPALIYAMITTSLKIFFRPRIVPRGLRFIVAASTLVTAKDHMVAEGAASGMGNALVAAVATMKMREKVCCSQVTDQFKSWISTLKVFAIL
jgi:hypothetical protein